MKHKKFEWMIMKNTLALVAPVLLILLAMIVATVRYSLFHVAQSYMISDTESVQQRVEALYAAKQTTVRYDAKNLYYTGYNYLVEGRIKGAYYYNFQDDYMTFFLVKTTNPEAQIESRTIRGRIIRDEVVTDHIVAGLAENGSIPIQILDGFYDSYVISEPDYPYVYTGIAYALLAVLAFVYVLVVSYVVRLWLHPYRNPQARKLRAFGRRSTVITQLNDELRDSLYFRYRGIYVTEDYLIATYWFHTDVIRLDDVRYLSKNRVEEKNGREIFRLTLSEPETDLFYEIDFKEEELIDACVEAIRG